MAGTKLERVKKEAPEATTEATTEAMPGQGEGPPVWTTYPWTGPLDRELRLVPIERVKPGPWLHRKEINLGSLTELADSIRQDGIRIPLEAVRRGPEEYWLFSGLRRYRAAGLVGLTALPLIVYGKLPEEVASRYSILENLHREDLSAMDTAHALEKLQGGGMDQPEMARALGKTQGWVSQYLGLLRLPQEAHQALEEKRITFSEARELQRVANEPDTIRSILSPKGKGLEKRIGYVPPGVSERVSRILEAKAKEEKLAAEVQALKDQGKVIIGDYQGYEDKRYVSLSPWDESKRLHDQHGLTCLVYAVDGGRVLTLCNDPKALAKVEREERKVTGPEETAYDRERRERKEREALQRQAITEVLRAWWQAKTPVGQEESLVKAASDLAALEEYYSKDSLDRMAEVMGVVEKKAKKEEIRGKVKALVFGAQGGELLRYWWLYLMVGAMDKTRLDWLTQHGYVDPTAPGTVVVIVAGGEEPYEEDRRAEMEDQARELAPELFAKEEP